MSGGLNKRFRANPSVFMAANIFDANQHSLLASVNGTCKLNLNFGTLLNNAVVKVEKAPNVRSKHSHAFDAYYLPFEAGKAPSIQLGTAANYFFTAALTGCRLIIGAGTSPQITHADGGYYNNTQLDNMCNVRSTNSFGTLRYWDNGNYWASVVIGVRGGGGWTFHAQSYDMDSTFPLTVQQV
jgi:hypothetical protein